MKDIVEIWDALKAGKKLKHVEPVYFKYILLSEDKRVVDQDGSAVTSLFTKPDLWSIYEDKVRIQVGDEVFEFARPVSEPLKVGTDYFVSDPVSSEKYYPVFWAGDDLDLHKLENNFIQLTKEDAIRQAECMGALFKKELSYHVRSI